MRYLDYHKFDCEMMKRILHVEEPLDFIVDDIEIMAFFEIAIHQFPNVFGFLVLETEQPSLHLCQFPFQ